MAKVLVVDDEPVYLALLKTLLEAEGHQVTTAETGAEAVETGRGACPDVLLVDWRLRGGLDGLQVARELRTANRRLGIIVMTGYSAADLGNEANDLEGLQVLRKPFDGDAVRQLVRQTAERTGQNSM